MKNKHKSISFKNNKGNIMKLRGSLTIEDLVKMGMKDIRIVPEREPLQDNWWGSQ